MCLRVLLCYLHEKKKTNLIRYNDKACKSEQRTKVTVKAHIYTERKKKGKRGKERDVSAQLWWRKKKRRREVI